MNTTRPSATTVGVILLTVDQRDKTLRCLESFRRVSEPPFRVVLWDNGSRDGTAEAVREGFPEVLIHRHPENLGVASGRNAAAELAIARCNPPFLLFLDNDMEVTPGFLSALVRPFDSDPRLAETTAKITFLSDRRRLYGAGGCYLSFWLGQTGHIGYGEVDCGQYNTPERCLPSGGCILVRTRVFRELSGFDPAFDPYGPEDLDFALRLLRAGYHGLYVPEAVVRHEDIPGHTFEGGMSSQLYVRNKMRLWLRFMRRHASFGQQLAFLLVGAPFGVLRMTMRETRRGNFRAIPGLMSGVLDYFRARRHR